MNVIHRLIRTCILKCTYEHQQNLHYIDTFGLFEGTDARVITIPREQYGATVHLLIGTGHNPSKSTFVSSTFTHNYNINH
jgi:hypothetical protein